MASKVRINLQIEDTSPLVREIIGSLKGEKGWTSTNPDEVVKVTYTVTAGEVEVINEGIYYSIPTITTAKEGDTAFSDDFRLFVYDEAGARWRLWASADRDDVKVYHNNTLIGDGTQSSPLGLNPTTIAFKGDLNPLLKGEDNGDGTYTFTTIDGSTSFTINAGLSGNIYNTNGTLTGNRTVNLDGKGLTFSGNQGGGEAFLRINSFGDGTFTVNTAGTPLIGVAFRALFARELNLYTGQDLTILTPTTDYYALKLVSTSGKVEYHPITADDIDDSTSTNKFVDQSLVNLISSALQPGDNISELNNDSDFIESSEKGQPLGVATLDSNGVLYTSQLPPISITEVIAASETTISAFAANSGNYTFQQGDVILIDDGGVVTHYLYKGGTKTDVGEYSELSASQIDWSQVVNTPTTLAGYGITDAGAAAPVQSVNSQSGAVVLDADDIDDSTTVHKFVTQALINTLNSAVQPGDLATVATSGDYDDLLNKPPIPDSLDDLSGNSDDITEGTSHLFMTTAERNKLSGIASGAEVNVNADWNAVSGDAQILNKPTLGTAAAANVGDFATAMQGALADTAVQPGDLATVATTGAYSDLTGTPSIPNSLDDLSGDSDDISEGTTNLFMTSSERSKLAGIASGAEVNVNADWNAVSGDAEILNKPTLGTAAAADTGDFATAVQGTKADTAIQPGDNVSDLTNDSGFVDAAGAAAAAPVQSVNGDIGAVTLDADDVGAIPASEKGVNNGVATLDANGQLQTSQVPSYAITEIIESSETSIAAFAANSGSYDFDIGDVILIDNGGVISHYLYKGGTKTDVNEYSAISASQVDWGNITNKPTLLYPGDNISELVNDEGFVDSAGAASAAPVQSVNGNTGAVTLDADDISDSSTTNKFVTQAEKNDIASAVQPGDLATVATTGAYSDLTGTPAIPEDSTDLGDTGDLVRNNADTYNSTPKVLQVITLTSAEMEDIINEVVSPIAGALYFEVE